MRLKTIYLMIIAMFSWASWAQFEILDSHLWNHISTNQLASVEVAGALRGSGIIVTLNGNPVVITNSHNIQGRKKATVKYIKEVFSYYDLNAESSERGQKRVVLDFNLELPVIIDDPLHDFALLSFDGKISGEELKLVKNLGQMSGNFCHLQNCGKNVWVPNTRFRNFETSLAVVLNGKREKIELLRGLEPQLIDDQIISGEKRKILSLPFYSRPGVSGGGFYYRGILFGLVTKVSLIGTPETYASTFAEIGKIINSVKDNKTIAEWRNGELYITVDGEEIVQKSSTNGGGETGHGGGETGHGGGETGHGGDSGPDANYWNLDFPKFIGGSRVMTTWNPFVRRSSVFVLDGQEIAYFQVDGKFQLPALATYRWNKNKKIKQKKFLYTPENLETLELARHKEYSGAVCGRVFNLNVNKGSYVSERGLQTTEADDSVLFVLADKKGKLPRSYQDPFPGPKKIFDVGGNWLDKDGWTRSWFTAAKRSPDLVLNFMRTELSMPISGESLEQLYHVTAGYDLDEVKLMKGGKAIILKRLESNSVSAILFSSEDSQYKAAFLYDVNDLTELERIYIQTPTGLSEIGPCKNFAGVRK